MKTFSPEGVKFVIADYAQQRVGVVFTDGTEKYQSFGELTSSENIVRSIFSPEYMIISHFTHQQDIVVTEIDACRAGDPLGGRPVIYLDQMHWATLAHIIARDESRIGRKSEIEPGRELLNKFKREQAVFPLSSATLNETTNMFNDRRYRAGLAVARIAAGWQMRHAVAVRDDEVVRALADQMGLDIPPMEPVVTLKPFATMPGQRELPGRDSWRYLIKCLSWSAAMLHSLIDANKVESDYSMVDAWVAVQQAATDQIVGDHGMTKRQKQDASYSVTWRDLRGHVESAVQRLDMVLSPDVDLRRLTSDCPSISRYAKWVSLRHTNSNPTRWKPNDLNDMTFLSCAAAYANYVVTERQAANMLRQVNASLGLKQNVFATLEECMLAFELDHGSNGSDGT